MEEKEKVALLLWQQRRNTAGKLLKEGARLPGDRGEVT